MQLTIYDLPCRCVVLAGIIKVHYIWRTQSMIANLIDCVFTRSFFHLSNGIIIYS